jgi:mono/diheme cytochrome c family protein
MSLVKTIIAGAAIAVVVGGAAAAQSARPQDRPASATGNAVRGKMLYEKTLRCYACHGFGGQTGSPRLVPMGRSEEPFVAYLRKPATPAMPAFADVPRQDLADVYAFIKSLPADAPSADAIPLLKDLIDRSTGR